MRTDGFYQLNIKQNINIVPIMHEYAQSLTNIAFPTYIAFFNIRIATNYREDRSH